MNIYTLILMSAFHAEQPMNCEEVAFESYYIAVSAEEGVNSVHLQQEYDEIGKGDALLKVIEAAYLLHPDPDKFRNNFEKACNSFDKKL